jgi:hypothetical protein
MIKGEEVLSETDGHALTSFLELFAHIQVAIRIRLTVEFTGRSPFAKAQLSIECYRGLIVPEYGKREGRHPIMRGDAFGISHERFANALTP